MRYREFVTEVAMDGRDGLGAVPLNADVDYFGIRVAMQPSMWLRMAHELKFGDGSNKTIDHLAAHIQQGLAIGQPWFNIDIPDAWEDGDLDQPARIVGHEGRHRMMAIKQVEGDAPVEVHLFFPGLRARHIKPEWIKRLNTNIIDERGLLTPGPWFTTL